MRTVGGWCLTGVMSEGVLTPDPRHRVARFVASTRADLDDLADVSAWSMSAAETREAMVELTRLEAQIAELQLRVADHGQTVEVADSGATSTANWWAHATKQTRAAAHRKTRLATALGRGVRADAGGAGARAGCWSTRPRSSWPRWRRCPPTSTTGSWRMRRDAGRVRRHHDARELRILGKRILEVVAPEVGEAHEARRPRG